MRSIASFLPLAACMSPMAALHVAATLRGEPLPEGWLIDQASGLFLLAWMLTDARRRRFVPCHELGFLAGTYPPASVAWYTMRTRGWTKGLGLLAALFGLLLIPGVAAATADLVVARVGRFG